MPPQPPYVLSGNAKKGLHEARSVISGTIGSGAGETINIFLGEATENATSLTVTFTHTSTGETISAVTDGSGNYRIDVGSMTNTYAVGDAFTITASTINSTALSDSAVLNGVRPVALVDENGNRFTVDYPLIVQVANDSLPYQNYSESYTYTGTNLTQIDKVINGVTYRQTLTYNGSNMITAKSAWIKQ